MQDNLKLKGRIKLELFDPLGNLKDVREVDNVIVTVGKAYLAEWLAQATQVDYFMQYIGLGTGTNAASAADTDLQTPLATRVAGNLSFSTNVWQNQATFGPGVNTGAITEAGIFSASTLGTLMARQVFGVITKNAGDSIVFTWQITFA